MSSDAGQLCILPPQFADDGARDPLLALVEGCRNGFGNFPEFWRRPLLSGGFRLLLILLLVLFLALFI
jgi:hypothetical protein